MKSFVASPFIAALLAMVLASLAPLPAQTTTAKVKKIPFHGTLQSFDASAGTVTLASKKEPAGRVFHTQSTTKIIDGAGNATTLDTAVAGEPVSGSYSKDASGNMLLNSLRLGAKAGSKAAAGTASAAPAAAPAPTPAPASTPAPEASAPAATPAPAATTAAASGKKSRFSGKVVSVDAASNTLVVHGKTYTVTSATKLTGVSGVGDITAGAKVSGSYQTDGTTLTVVTLKVTQ